MCFHWYAAYEAINYTQLQYPPPNSLLSNCMMPGHGPDWTPASETEVIAASPMFSYPQDVTLLVPSWKSCTLTNIIGAMDPPHTLGQATAMAPVSSSSPAAAPAAHITPANAPSTPTPSPKDPPGGALKSPESSVDPVKLDPASDPKASSGSGSQQDPHQSNPQNVEAPKTDTATSSSVHPPTNAPPSNSDSSSHDALSSNEPSKPAPMTNDPSNNDPTKSDPSSGDSPSNNNSPSSDHPKDNPPANDPQRNSKPSSDDPPINNSPSTKDPPNNNDPPSNDPSKNNPTSIMPTPILASPPTNVQPHAGVDRHPSSTAPNEANHMHSQDLGAQIASAFGYVPGSTASPVNDPSGPNADPKPVGIFVDGTPTPVIAGGNSVQRAPNGAVLVAGQTIAQGSQATVSRAVVSVGSNNVVVDGTNHALSPMASATLTPLMVGAHTAQRVPNGGLVVASQTFAPGAQATVAGVVVSVGSGKAILDGTTRTLAPIALTPLSLIVDRATTAVQPGVAGASEAPSINIGGQAMTLSQASPGINVAGQTLTPEAPHQGSPFIIAGQTLTPGGAAITVSGIPISLPASQTPAANLPAMAIEASAFQTGGPMHGVAPVTVGTQVFTPNPSAFEIAGTTISAGGPGITVAGTVISLQSSGAGLVIGSSTLALATSAASPGVPTAITIGDQVFTPKPSAFAIAGTTISAGEPGVIIAGTFISLQPSGTGLVVGSSTLALAASTAYPGSPTPITIDNQVFTPNPTGFSIAGTTLSAGAEGITIDGTAVSLQPSGAGLVVGSRTITLPSQPIAPNAITIGKQIFTPNPTGFSIAGTTLSAGGPGITVDGTVVSLEASGVGLVIGSSTVKLQGTSSSAGSTNAEPSSGAASMTSDSVAGDTSSIPSAGSVISAPSSGSTIASAQPTRAVSSGGHTQYARGRAGLLALFVVSVLALFISASI